MLTFSEQFLPNFHDGSDNKRCFHGLYDRLTIFNDSLSFFRKMFDIVNKGTIKDNSWPHKWPILKWCILNYIHHPRTETVIWYGNEITTLFTKGSKRGRADIFLLTLHPLVAHLEIASHRFLQRPFQLFLFFKPDN